MEANQSVTVTVLAVDDESDNAELIRRSLAFRADLRVLVAFSAREAFAVAQTTDIDLLVLDQRMPDMTGTQLLKRLKETGTDADAIMVTAFPEDGDVVAARTAGLLQWIVAKPWEAADLLMAVEMALMARRNRSARSSS